MTLRVSLILTLTLLAFGADADTARNLIARGNDAFARQDYDAAIDAYDEASVDLPESAVVLFNKGVAFYGKEAYEKARELFDKAVVASPDASIEAKCLYNLGNCAFRQAQRRQDGDLEKAIAAYEESIRFYSAALDRDKGLQQAARNIEVARLILKDLLDKLKKQQEQAQKEAQKKQELADKLKDLIEQQKKNVARNEDVSDKVPGSEEFRKKLDELADAQKQTLQDTTDLAEKLRHEVRSTPDQTPPAMDKAAGHVDQSAGHQESAVDTLGRTRPWDAREDQEKALEELEKALDALKDQQQPQEQPQGQEDQRDEEQQQQPQENEGEPQQQPDKQADEQQAIPLTDTAKDILEEEKENRDRRRLRRPAGYRPVDKDW